MKKTITIAVFVIAYFIGICVGWFGHKGYLWDKVTYVQTDTVVKYQNLSERELLILSMMSVESEFNPQAVGLTNDKGILQITPIYVAEVNRILGEDKYVINDAFDVKLSLDMFEHLQGHYNPSQDFIQTIYWHNKSNQYRDKVIQRYNQFLSYERFRSLIISYYE